MRRCLDCNAELPNAAMECTECGSQNLSLIEEKTTEKTALPKKVNAFIIVIAAVFVIGVVCGFFAYKYSAKTVPAEPIKNAMNSLYTGDLQGYIDEMYKSFQSDAENYLNNEYGSFSSYKDSTEETLKNAYGDDYKVVSEVIDVYPFTDKMVEFLNDACKEAGYKVEITDAKNVTVRTVTKNDDGAESYYIADEYSAEIDGKWYFVPKGLLVSNESDNSQTN